jgi:hypothetical protein
MESPIRSSLPGHLITLYMAQQEVGLNWGPDHPPLRTKIDAFGVGSNIITKPLQITHLTRM